MTKSTHSLSRSSQILRSQNWSSDDPVAYGIHPIRNRDDHRAALRAIDRLMDSKGRTRENAYLEAIGVLVNYYELKRLNRSRKTLLVRPYNELVWKRFSRDPDFAQAPAAEVRILSQKRVSRRK